MPAVTSSGLLTMISVLALGSSVAFALLLLAKSRWRRLAMRHERQSAELSLVVSRQEREREEYDVLLLQAKRELFELNQRHLELMTRLPEAPRGSAANGPIIGAVLPAPVAPARVHSVGGDEDVRVRKLETTLAEMRRGRELAEQRAEKLRVANQARSREIASLTTQLDQLALSVEESRVVLAESERRTMNLQEHAQAATGQLDVLRREMQLLVRGREQLELQNVELKRMLDCVGQPPPPAASVPICEAQGGSARERNLIAADDWERVTELDIGDVIVAIAEQPQPVVEQRSSPAAPLVALDGMPEPIDSEQREARSSIELQNSGTYPIARPAHGMASESREVAAEPFDAAVLSDNLGLPIAAQGIVSAESLAAVSGLALSNAERVRELLPIGPIRTVQWLDEYGMAVTCRLLHLADDQVVMTTLGAGTPSEKVLRETLKSVLNSIGWNEKGPLEEDESNTATG